MHKYRFLKTNFQHFIFYMNNLFIEELADRVTSSQMLCFGDREAQTHPCIAKVISRALGFIKRVRDPETALVSPDEVSDMLAEITACSGMLNMDADQSQHAFVTLLRAYCYIPAMYFLSLAVGVRDEHHWAIFDSIAQAPNRETSQRLRGFATCYFLGLSASQGARSTAFAADMLKDIATTTPSRAAEAGAAAAAGASREHTLSPGYRDAVARFFADTYVEDGTMTKAVSATILCREYATWAETRERVPASVSDRTMRTALSSLPLDWSLHGTPARRRFLFRRRRADDLPADRLPPPPSSLSSAKHKTPPAAVPKPPAKRARKSSTDDERSSSEEEESSAEFTYEYESDESGSSSSDSSEVSADTDSQSDDDDNDDDDSSGSPEESSLLVPTPGTTPCLPDEHAFEQGLWEEIALEQAETASENAAAQAAADDVDDFTGPSK